MQRTLAAPCLGELELKVYITINDTLAWSSVLTISTSFSNFQHSFLIFVRRRPSLAQVLIFAVVNHISRPPNLPENREEAASSLFMHHARRPPCQRPLLRLCLWHFVQLALPYPLLPLVHPRSPLHVSVSPFTIVSNSALMPWSISTSCQYIS